MEIFPGDHGMAAHPQVVCPWGILFGFGVSCALQCCKNEVISASQMTGVGMLSSVIKGHNNPED